MTSDDFRSARESLRQELGELQERLRFLRERLDVKREGMRETYRRELDVMTSDKSRAYRYLRGSDRSLRLLALETLADYWTPDPTYYEECERLAAEDPEDVVRAHALKRLGDHFAGTANHRLMTLAARAARDERSNESAAF